MKKIKRKIKATEILSLGGMFILPLLMVIAFLLDGGYQTHHNLIIMIMGLIIFELSMYIRMDNLKKKFRRLKRARY